MRNQPPARERNLANRFFWVLPDNRDLLRWRDIEPRVPVLVPRSSVEVSLNDLLSPRQPIPTTHIEGNYARKRGSKRATCGWA